MALIEYIGKQTNRVDDVLKTSRVWTKAGDVVDVPDVDKHHYLIHAGEWCEITPEEHQAKNAARLDIEARLSSMARIWGALSVPEIKALVARMEEEVRKREKVETSAVATQAKMANTKAKTEAAMAAAAGKTQPLVGLSNDVKLKMKMALDNVRSADRDDLLETADEFGVRVSQDEREESIRAKLTEFLSKHSAV